MVSSEPAKSSQWLAYIAIYSGHIRSTYKGISSIRDGILIVTAQTRCVVGPISYKETSTMLATAAQTRYVGPVTYKETSTMLATAAHGMLI